MISAGVKGKDSGYSEEISGKSVLVEFVSANPHGPITVDNGRCGVVGDVLSKLLEAVGCKVTREYYVNDMLNSVQLENFGRSLEVRYLQALGHDIKLPDDGYQGDYVVEIARRIVERDGDKHVHLPRGERVRLFTRIGREEMLERQKRDLDRLGISFDGWYSESALFESGMVEQALQDLRNRGYAYPRGESLWLKSTAFGDEIDRPLVRDSGQATYIASDVAYHKDKFDRGFDRLINVWGPQHEAYITRAKAAIEALGYDSGRLDILIHKDVKLFSGGEQVMMAKRRGEFVALTKLIDEVGADATRFFLLATDLREPLDFDLDLARAQSDDNPLYSLKHAYVQAKELSASPEHNGAVSTSGIDEGALSIKLSQYPEVLKSAAALYEPHRLTAYAVELASLVHSCCEQPEDPASKALAADALKVIGEILNLLGLSIPEV